MKTVLKTMSTKWDLDYDETFTSDKNIKVCRSLIPELKQVLAPNFHPSASQLTNWLSCLHKSRRSKNKIRQSGKSVAESRRVYNNNQVQDVSIYNMNLVCLYIIFLFF